MQELDKLEVFRYAQYDKNQVEIYLLFSHSYMQMDAETRASTKILLERMFTFENLRQRAWRIIYFRSPGDVDETEFLDYE